MSPVNKPTKGRQIKKFATQRNYTCLNSKTLGPPEGDLTILCSTIYKY